MSGSTREQDALKAKRAAAKQLRSAERDVRQWAKRAGGLLAQVFGQRDQEPEPQRARAGAAAGRGTGQRNGCVTSSVPDSDLPSGDDYEMIMHRQGCMQRTQLPFCI